MLPARRAADPRGGHRLARDLGIALLVAALAGCRGEASHEPPARVTNPVHETDLTTVTLTPKAEGRLGIRTAPVARRGVGHTRSVGGEVIPIEGGSVVVTAPVAGTLAAPAGGVPRPGAKLKQGQAVFRLVPLLSGDRDLRPEAERAVAATRARLEAASAETRRAEQLLKDGAASVRQVEEARAALGEAEAAFTAARDRLALVNRTPVDEGGALAAGSPIDASLQRVQASAGQTVAAGAPLFEVARFDPIWVRVALYVGELAAVDTERGATVVGLGEAAEAPGRQASYVQGPPTADPAAAAADIFFQLANADGAFRPGEKVAVRLSLRGAAEERVVVPVSALLYDIYGGTWIYESTAPHVFIRRRVEVADLLDSLAVLARGPGVGAKVVTVGAAELFGTEFGPGK